MILNIHIFHILIKPATEPHQVNNNNNNKSFIFLTLK